MNAKITCAAIARKSLLKAAILVAIGCLPLASQSQASFPSRPITIVVPFPPGGTSDTAARQISMALGKVIKQPIVILNRAGAGGAVGTASVVNAEPDGHTLLMGLSSIATTPESDRLAGRKPLYEVRQLIPIARVSADPLVVVVRDDSPYRTLKDLIEDARKRPGGISYATSGNYGPNHVAIEMFADASSIKMLHVPYSGGAATVSALLGGQVDFTLMGPSVAGPNRKAGKVRLLGVYGASRLPSLPDVPTLKESGVDIEYYIWSGLFAPRGTPDTTVSAIRDAIRAAIQDAQFQGGMNAVEMPPAYQDAPEFQRFVELDSARLVQAVKRIGKLE